MFETVSNGIEKLVNMTYTGCSALTLMTSKIFHYRNYDVTLMSKGRNWDDILSAMVPQIFNDYIN